MYIPRILARKIKKSAGEFPIVALIGPRQSGKTTLVKEVFKDYHYVSLEDLDTREFAIKDPRGFLANYSHKVIFDEIQKTPELFSYLQGVVDKEKKAGQFILTGSQHFLLQSHISQSLAGRVALFSLLPLSLEELKKSDHNFSSLDKTLLKGFYPALYDQKRSVQDWYANYILTYIERDVRQLKNITDLGAFQTFLKMCAGRTGQILNLSSLASDCGITHNTAKAWLSVLEASFIIFLLKPHYKNFNKRLIKMPKIYFYDTGIAASLLGIESDEQINTHHLKGSLFESLIISEFIKQRFNQGLNNNCYYWRDKLGHEIDCLLEKKEKLIPVEIKSSKTINDDYFKDILYWQKLAKTKPDHSYVVYGGEESQKRTSAAVVSWQNLDQILD